MVREMKFQLVLKNAYMREVRGLNIMADSLPEVIKSVALDCVMHYYGEDIAAVELYQNGAYIMRVMVSYTRPCIAKLPTAKTVTRFKLERREVPSPKYQQLVLSL